MVDIGWHQQKVIVIQLIEDGVIFQTAIVVAEDGVCCPHDREIAHGSRQQMVEERPCVAPLHPDLTNGRNIEDCTTVPYRVVFGFSIAIVVWQCEFIPVDVVLVLN